jgi:glutaconyl-CoA/methylmalonyl-CoA decarboxylase subunit gamma
VSGGSRVRVSIESVPLVIQPAADEIALFEPERRGELVHAQMLTGEDRALGILRIQVVVDGWLFDVTTESASRAELRERVAKQAAEHQATTGVTLRAQIPGRVVKVWIHSGQNVERGDRLLAIEAMKMENEIRAPRAGVVESVKVELGDRIAKDDELVNLR